MDTNEENNQLISENGDTTCYYALQSVPLEYDENNKAYIHSNPYSYERVGVRDASMTFSMEDFYSYSEEVRVATFAVVEDTTPLYRRLGETLPEDGFEDMTVQNAKIYTINSAEKEYLYEDANSKYSENLGINFLGVESCIVMLGGHTCNVNTLKCLMNRRDLILYDELAHNSIIEGAVYSGAARMAFRHNDVEDLQRILSDHRCDYEKVMICIEGVYSMDGDIPDLYLSGCIWQTECSVLHTGTFSHKAHSGQCPGYSKT